MQVYLDYNATTPVDPEVLRAMLPYFEDRFANASSIHRKGQEARHAVEEARELIADSLRVEPGDIIFTSGGTEADNLALKGMMAWLGEKRPHMVVSTIEHQAVLHVAQFLEKTGLKVTYVPTDSKGIVDLERLKKAVTDKTALVSLMHVNNELGTIQPIQEAAKIAHAKGAYFHTDAVQSFGKLDLDAEAEGADLISVSAHKICGPKGAGALYVKKGLRIQAVTHGGHQEKNIRPGTENVPAIVGFGKAVQLAGKFRHAESERVKALRDKLEHGILEKIPDSEINGDIQKRIYSTSNVSFKGLDGETLLINLDLKGICVSTGSACTAGSVEPSHVLLALGLEEKIARSAVRFSLGRFTVEKEIDTVLAELPEAIEKLRKSSTERTVKPATHSKLP